jgi:hypothetical protein
MKNDRYFYHGVVFFALLFLASSAGFAQARENAIAARSATVDGVKLHYLNAGHGPTVIHAPWLHADIAHVDADHPGPGREIYGYCA